MNNNQSKNLYNIDQNFYFPGEKISNLSYKKEVDKIFFQLDKEYEQKTSYKKVRYGN
jgi:hypothetical protein